MSWINLLISEFWSRLSHASDVQLDWEDVTRSLMCIALLTLLQPSFVWLSEIPQALFDPKISIAYFFDSVPEKIYIQLLQSVLIVSISCIALRIKTTLSSIVFITTFFVLSSLAYSFGKIDHNILLPLSVLALGIGYHWNSTSRLHSTSFIALFICIGFFSAGIPKALSWIDFDLSTSGILSWHSTSYYMLERTMFWSSVLSQTPPLLLEFMDYSVVAFEVAGLAFLFVSRRAWHIWIVIACFFHLMCTLTLNIPFVSHFFVFLVFLGGPFWVKKLSLLHNRLFLLVIIGSLCSVALIRTWSPELMSQFYLLFTNFETLYLALCLWIIGLVLSIHRLYYVSNEH